MKKADEAIPNNKLKQERVERNWTQGQVAEKIGTTRVNVSRWEHGRVLPEMYFRQQLCELFGKNAHELGLLPENVSANGEQPVQCTANTQDVPSTVSTTSSPLWHVPYRRNPFFTGREEILQLLHDALHRHPVAALIQSAAISGLGGIGKTQTAIEYAYRYRDHYQAVFWLKADSSEVLIADMITLAEWLGLPERQQQDQQRIIEAVRLWLNTHHDWLLLLDNVEDPTTLHNLLPSNPGGSILLTTRSQVTGTIAERVGLEQMEPEEGALFLLRRAGLVARDACLEKIPPAVRGTAQDISHLLGGLPLALDQAGAYIEETGCSLAHYLTCYQTRQATLLNRRGASGVDHPMSVATTFSLALEQVEHVNPAAADLLRLSAFLHPDAIPEEIISTGASEPGSPLQPLANDLMALDAAITTLRRFSLVRRNAETKTLAVHRLVQAVVKDSMDEDTQRLWMERTVRLINRIFPDPGSMPVYEETSTWLCCQHYYPHVQVCMKFIERWNMTSPEAIELFVLAGNYFYKLARYSQAEELFRKVLTIRERVVGAEHPDVAESLSDVATLSSYCGNYAQAELLYQRSLAIFEKTLGPEHPTIARVLQALATHYHHRGKYAQVGPLYQRALAILKKTLGAEHSEVAENLNDLARLYTLEGKYAQAESLYQQSLFLYEKVWGSEYPELAIIINNMAELYRHQGRYAEAELWYRRASSMWEQGGSQEHPRVAQILHNMGLLRRDQEKYAQAEMFFQQAQTIYEKTLGPEHPRAAQVYDDLAQLFISLGRYAEAESLYRRSLATRQGTHGLEHPDTAESLYGLARLYSVEQAYAQADPLYQRALVIWEKALEPDHPSIISCLENYAELLRKTHGESEAARYEARVRQLRARETLEQPTLSARQKRAETSHQ